MASDSLRIVNAFIGFCVPTDTWPSPFVELGYVPCGVEREIVVDVGETTGRVVVDLILASVAQNHSVCGEAKSRTLDLPQARKYEAIIPENLVNMANLPPDIQPASLTHDVVYLTMACNSEDLAGSLEEDGLPFALVACGDDQFRLVRGSFSDDALHQLLEGGIEIAAPVQNWPMAYVPFLGSSVVSEIVPHLAQHLSGFLLRGSNFTIIELAERILPHWDWFGNEEQRLLRDKFCQLIEDGRRNELREYYRRPSANREWEALLGPLRPPHQTMRLAGLMNDFVARVQTEHPLQAPLEGPFLSV